MTSILVVDDNILMLDMMYALLLKTGFRVYTASNGQQAEKVCQKENVDLAIVDLVMPGQDGMQTLSALEKSHPKMKLIAMTGGGEATIQMYLEAANLMGFVHTLKKPFHRNHALNTINRVLDIPTT